jgi:hypothetical protein
MIKLPTLPIILCIILIHSNALALQSVKVRKDKFNDRNLTEFLQKKDKKEHWDFWQHEIQKYLDPDSDDNEKLKEIEAILTKDIHEKYKRELSLVPIKRDIKKAKSSKSMAVRAYGYKINLPWGKEDEIFRFDTALGVFKYNNWAIVFDNPTENSLPGSYAYKDWKSEDHLNLIFYNGPPKNQYEFTSAVLHANASDLTNSYDIKRRIKEKVLLWSLIFIKQLYTLEYEKLDYYVNSIYSFDETNVKGFQIGNPKSTDLIVLVLFPNDDVELNLQIFKGKNGEVTQDHIDYIIHNFEQIKENKQ